MIGKSDYIPGPLSWIFRDESIIEKNIIKPNKNVVEGDGEFTFVTSTNCIRGSVNEKNAYKKMISFVFIFDYYLLFRE